LLDVATGRVAFFIIPYLSAKSFIDSGQLIAIAVARKMRTPVLPDVPTMAETGFPDTEYPFWNVIFAPAKTPREIIDRLHGEIVKACDATRDKLAKFGAEPMNESPGALDAIACNQIKINANLIKMAGIKVS
jgi:tripartite-type tricarboxylate transporter receptor subunit TctC